MQVAADADPDGSRLSLRFADGSLVEGEVELLEPVETDFFGRPVAGRIVGGGFSEALSTFAGRPLTLVRVDEAGAGSDRGVGAAVSAVSEGSLEALAEVAAVADVDRRRFRMLFGIGGVAAHEEDTWIGRRVAFGDAVVLVHTLVGRCAVTSHDPDTGVRSLDTLRTIRRYRSDVVSEEALPFGVCGQVEKRGRVRVGDLVEPL